MKEFDPIHDKPEQTEIHAVTSIKKTLVMDGTFRPRPGQKMWELNLATAIITEAEYEEEVVALVESKNIITGKKNGVTQKIIKKLIRKENCLYWPAVNWHNADKHFHKLQNKPFKKKK